MGVQGMVTICRGGQVKMKIVVGCKGHNAPKIAAAIRKLGGVPTTLEACQLAVRHQFGCANCLTVVTDTELVTQDNEPRPPRYRETLAQPRFNPCWPSGRPDELVVVEF